MEELSTEIFLKETFKRLFKHFGAQHWWPGETPFEVMVGAILTQNTNWGNVEKAIKNLKAAQSLNPLALHRMSHIKLAQLIKPAGYFNVKAKRLKNFLEFIFKEYGGNIEEMKKESLSTLRLSLLTVNGIGPETADSILLYALEKPIFVVDTYTKRFLYRHQQIISKDVDYHDVQDMFGEGKAAFFNEYHALIVRVAKDYCRTRPRCEECPLRDLNYSLENRCKKCFRFKDQRSKDCCEAVEG